MKLALVEGDIQRKKRIGPVERQVKTEMEILLLTYAVLVPNSMVVALTPTRAMT